MDEPPNGNVPSRPPRKVIHLSLAERAALGKAARASVPRSMLGEWQRPADRPDPIALLEEQAASRVPELVPIRYGRMLVSPFSFYRGGAYLMASDLAAAPRTGLTVQLCGDAHLSNFGVFAAPDRRLVFGLNDFDETLPGPFEWDLKRLVASFTVAARERGLDPAQRNEVTLRVIEAYRQSMRDFAQMRTLDAWYARIDVEELEAQAKALMNRSQQKQLERNVAKARAKDSIRALGKLITMVDGRPTFTGDPPLIVPIEGFLPDWEVHQVEEWIRGTIRAYRRSLPGDRRRLLERYRYAGAARKVVGVGSVGTRAWIVLMLGRDDSDPLFLQAKEAQSSVLEPFLGKSTHATHGQRVVEGQRLMQSTSDIMLGWVRTTGIDGVLRDFYVRQLWDGKGSAVVETMEPRMLALYARFCGWALARAHARSGDAVAIASYLGTSNSLDLALAAFGESYADQNERDHARLEQAVRDGTVMATTGL